MALEKRKLCFVLMPFKSEMKEIYTKAIKPACRAAGFDCLRMDEKPGVYNINQKIIEHIFLSDAVIADLTGWNPNVFYEMGVAHAIDNKTVMIIQSGDKIPFDVSTYSCIQYERTETGLKELKKQLTKVLCSMQEWRQGHTNPVQQFKPQGTLVAKNHLIEMEKKLSEKENEIRRLKESLEEKGQKIHIIRDEVDITKPAEPGKTITPLKDFVLIPAGEFIMGTSKVEVGRYLKKHPDWSRVRFKDEIPKHVVYLDEFYIKKYPVTNIEFAKFINEYGKVRSGEVLIKSHDWGLVQINGIWKPQAGFENHPVINVSWYGADAYAKWANCRLPTEAEWEKAARGGKNLEYGTMDGTLSMKTANCLSIIGKTTRVDNYLPNPYGLYDMSGNVWEFCLDYYQKDFYKRSPGKNPLCNEKSETRVMRGGSWSFDREDYFRCASRIQLHPDNRDNSIGFRVAHSV